MTAKLDLRLLCTQSLRGLVKMTDRWMDGRRHRVITNSKFGLFYSNFFIVTPTFLKAAIERYCKTHNFSGRHFYSCFQNHSKKSETDRQTDRQTDALLAYAQAHIFHSCLTL